MSDVHCIRLRGPWEYRSGDTTGRIVLPGDWLASLQPGLSGGVRFFRRFNCPTGLDEQTVVELVTSGLPAGTSLLLNDASLPCSTRSRITELLKPQNQLEVRFDPTAASHVAGEVWLEIQ